MKQEPISPESVSAHNKGEQDEASSTNDARWRKIYFLIVAYTLMLIILLWAFSRVFGR